MENNPLRHRETDNISLPSPERALESKKRSLLQRLRHSAKAKVALALMAVGGASQQESVEAANMVPGVVLPAEEANWFPQRVWGIDNYLGTNLSIAPSIDDDVDDPVGRWFAIELREDLYQQGYAFDMVFPLAANEGVQVVGVDQQPGGEMSRTFLLVGDFEEGDIVHYLASVNNGLDQIDNETAFVDATAYAGYGNITGPINSLEDAIENTDGDILVGKYPSTPLEDTDVTIFLELPTQEPIAGDYNGDGVVDSVDYATWRNNYGASGSGVLGDGNGDGIVDAADYTVWRDNYNPIAAASSSANGVPEGSTGGLVAMGIASLGAVNRRRVRDAVSK